MLNKKSSAVNRRLVNLLPFTAITKLTSRCNILCGMRCNLSTDLFRFIFTVLDLRTLVQVCSAKLSEY